MLANGHVVLEKERGRVEEGEKERRVWLGYERDKWRSRMQGTLSGQGTQTICHLHKRVESVQDY